MTTGIISPLRSLELSAVWNCSSTTVATVHRGRIKSPEKTAPLSLRQHSWTRLHCNQVRAPKSLFRGTKGARYTQGLGRSTNRHRLRPLRQTQQPVELAAPLQQLTRRLSYLITAAITAAAEKAESAEKRNDKPHFLDIFYSTECVRQKFDHCRYSRVLKKKKTTCTFCLFFNSRNRTVICEDVT